MKTIQALSILVSLLFVSCSGASIIKEMHDEHYQPVGSAVLLANSFLIADNPDGLTYSVDTAAYKLRLLIDNQVELYNAIVPMNLLFTSLGPYFKVEVFDDDVLILIDISCTESRVDCFTYDGRCEADTVMVWCR